MKKVFKVTSIVVGYVFANNQKEAETLFENDEEIYCSGFTESEEVDLQELIDELEYDLRK